MVCRVRVLLAAVFVALGTGCGPSESAERVAAKARRSIAVIPKGTTHDFWSAVRAGAEHAAAELGVTVIWKGPIREDDREGQCRVVEDLISKRVDGVVLAPLDERALVRPVVDANREGIPVVVIDSALAGGDQVSFVATDNYQGGVLAARHLGTLLKGKGRALVMRYQVGSASTDKRERGFLETLAGEFPGITVVSENQYAGATTAEATVCAENLLVRFEALDGVFTPNETSTTGMLLALRAGGRAGKVAFVGFDASEKLLGALEAGTLHGLVLQDPFGMGDLGVRTMVRHLNGEVVEKRVDTGVHLATRDNLKSPEIQRLLTFEGR